MKKRIFNFQDYVNESYLIKEGIFSWLKSTIIDKFTGWTKDFFDMLSSGAIRKIKRGPKKGLPGAKKITLDMAFQMLSYIEFLKY